VIKVYDLEIHLSDTPGSLAWMGTTLGNAGVSVEGGGAWVINGKAVAHFLFEDGPAARRAVESVEIRVLSCRRVLRLRLYQEIPGQLGTLTNRMAQAGLNIEVLYSDNSNHIMLVVDESEGVRR
jgi:hypothetical protein